MSLYGTIALHWYVLAGVLLLFHLWYDFHVQGSYIASGKRTSNLLLTVHAATWALFVSVPLYLVGNLTPEMLTFLFVTHWVMDWIKGHLLPEKKEWSLLLDQAVHLATLAVCVWRW